MGAQARYWQELIDLKRDCFYVDRYLSKTEHIDRAINIFLAFTSSAAIAGWALWQHVGFLWALLIAGSQVVNAARPWLPFSRRLKALSMLSPEYSALSIIAERDWYAVASGELTEAEIHARYIELKSRKHEITRTAMAEASLPEQRDLVEDADRSAQAYFAQRYGG
jgi:hypothetical protein